jgi:radical SAM superfamily enzyme YgiQ (UPF0313 family)
MEKKEKIKLIVPPYNFVTANEGILPILPIGVAYLCDFMRKNGWLVDVDDLDIKIISNKEILDRMLFLDSKIDEKKVEKYLGGEKNSDIEEVGDILFKFLDYKKYDVFGFSLIERLGVKYSLILAKVIRQKKKSAGIIFGGSLAENIISFSSDGLVDILVLGRGENVLLDFCKKRVKNKKKTIQKGKKFFRGIDNPDVTLENKPNFKGLSLDLYKKIPRNYAFHNFTETLVIPYNYSYGCPYNCTFCGNSLHFEKKIFNKSPEGIIKDLISLKEEFKTSFFAIYNEYIHVNEKMFKETCLMLEELKLNLTLAGCVRGNFSPNNVSLMANAGFRMVTIGLESGSDHILTLMKKGTNRRMIKSLIQELNKNGIFKLCYIIVGFPGEGEKDFQETFSFIRENIDLIDQISISIFRLERCFVRSFPEKFGIRIKNKTNINLSHHTPSNLPEYDEINGKEWEGINNEKKKRFYILHRLFYLYKKIPQYFYRSSFNEIMYLSRKYRDPKKTQIELRKMYEKFRQNKPLYLKITDKENIRSHFKEDIYLPVKAFFEIKKIFEIIEEEKNKKELILLGGEPTLVPDLVKIIAFAKKKGWEKMTLFTNGRMFFYKNYAVSLKSAGLCKIVVFIYGHNAKLHDEITGVEGSFKQTIEGIKFWKRLGGKIEIFPIILDKNEKYLYEMIELDWEYSDDTVF